MKKGKKYIGVGGGCLILNDKEEILLIRRAGEVRNEAGWWSKPGGGIKFGEKAKDAMIREMKEELSIDVKIVGLLPHTDHIIKSPNLSVRDLAIVDADGGNIEHWVALNFVAKIINGQPKNMEPHKCDKIGWFPLGKLPKKITQTTREPIENYLAGRYFKV
jgi:ADP-ribose pyrophosphatase YjhB (NUDIX family)